MSPLARRATLRLLTVVLPEQPLGSVGYWDQRTAGNDARTALSLALGATVDQVHPARGTWTPPAVPVQLALDVA
jgi:hypothetical protein